MMDVVQQRLGLWIPQVQGQYIDVDAGFGAQCWDLAAHWSMFLGLPVINTGNTATREGRWPGWAGNIVDVFPQTPAIDAAYELVGPNETGQPGDFAVWGDTYWYYPKTHIAVLVADKRMQLQCMSQNSTPARADNPYPGDSTGPTTIQYLPRQGLIGFIRPRTRGLAAQGTITSNDSEEDFMAGLIDAEQAEAIAKRAAALTLEGLFEVLDNKVRINAVQAEAIVQATTARTTDAVDERNTGKKIDRGQADDIARAAARYAEEEAK
jgi:hypothetical protein